MMKSHNQNIQNKSKKVEISAQTKKKSSFSQIESPNEITKKKNNPNPSPQKSNDPKKDTHKNDKNTSISTSTKTSDKINLNSDISKSGNNAIHNNYINPNNNNNNHITFNNKKIEEKSDNKKRTDAIQEDNKVITHFNPNEIKINGNNKINPGNKEEKKNISEISSGDENFYKQLKDNDKKLKDKLQAYNNINKKGEGASINTLFRLRSILIGWLKDNDQDLEYSKFMTEKKLKYLMKNKEKSEMKIKAINNELKEKNLKIEEIKKILGEIYCFYDEDGLKEDIKRFENSNEVKSGKFSKTLEQLETMKKMLPYVSEYGKLKNSITKALNEKKELEKIVKSSGQTLVFLSNYYKNIKKKINEQISNNN